MTASRALSPLALAILCLPLAAQATLPERPAPLGKQHFRERREQLATMVAKAAGGECVVLVRGAAKASDMGPFVQDQDFLYLSGVQDPDVALLLTVGANGKLVGDELLVPPFSRFAAVWDGDFLAPGEETAKRTGFATAGNVRALAERLTALLAAGKDGVRPPLFTATAPAARLGSTPRKAADSAAEQAKDPFDGRPSREAALRQRLEQLLPGLRIEPLEPVLHALRPHKTKAELALLRRSAEIAAEGIVEAMKSARPGVFEYQLAAVARYVFSLRGAGPDAYAAIVGAGPNGCVLHYSRNDRELRPDDLIVMDYAATLHGHAADVTRTFPASGKFTPAQRKLVQDVHDIQQELLGMVKPGASLGAIGARCAELLVKKGYTSDHGPCHHVGLAVHDPSVDVLEAGMVITVEPGAYLRKEGMGCRIEDTIVVTADGFESFSRGVPSAPEAIEALMKQKGLLDVPVGGTR